MDDDRDLSLMVRALASPRGAPTNGASRIIAEARRSNRRHRRLQWALSAVAILAAMALGAALLAFPSRSRPGPASSGARPLAVSEGVLIGVEMDDVSFDSDRLLTKGSFVVDGLSSAILFYNGNGNDNSYASERVHAGDPLSLFANIEPDCGRAGIHLPIAVVESILTDGEHVTQRFSVDARSAAKYRTEVRSWCSTPVHASIDIFLHGPWRQGVGRGEKVTINLSNTTDRRITVTSARLAYGSTIWSPASVVLPPRSSGTIKITATGYRGGPKPWREGLLRADGQPLRVN